MNVKFQNQSIILPRPPLAKGGWGDLALIHLWFITSCELCHLAFTQSKLGLRNVKADPLQ